MHHLDEITKELIYDQFLQVYHGHMTRADAISHLCDHISIYRPNTFGRYLDAFLHMMSGTSFASRMPIDLAIYFVERIEQDFGSSACKNAMEALKMHIAYYYGVRGDKSSGLCRKLQAMAAARNISISFLPE